MAYIFKVLESAKANLNQLKLEKQAFFAALTCEKMLPAYQLFSKEANWGNPSILEEILILLYEFINGNEINMNQIKDLESELEINAPDLDEIENSFASYGLDACAAFDESLSFILTKNIDHLVNIVSSATNIVDMCVQEKESLEPSDKDLEIKIENDPFMQKELKRQETIIKALQDIELNSQTIAKLRKLNNYMGEMLDFSLLPYR